MLLGHTFVGLHVAAFFWFGHLRLGLEEVCIFKFFLFVRLSSLIFCDLVVDLAVTAGGLVADTRSWGL